MTAQRGQPMVASTLDAECIIPTKIDDGGRYTRGLGRCASFCMMGVSNGHLSAELHMGLSLSTVQHHLSVADARTR